MSSRTGRSIAVVVAAGGAVLLGALFLACRGAPDVPPPVGSVSEDSSFLEDAGEDAGVIAVDASGDSSVDANEPVVTAGDGGDAGFDAADDARD
jgi:hypothetical protein